MQIELSPHTHHFRTCREAIAAAAAYEQRTLMAWRYHIEPAGDFWKVSVEQVVRASNRAPMRAFLKPSSLTMAP
jgi:hypothetical protein